jgi:glycosyltransferase involved in cell wall biosynthesis
MTTVDARFVASGRTFLRFAVRSGLLVAMLHPRRVSYVVSLGRGVSPRVLRLLRRLGCVLLYLDVSDEPRRQYRDLEIRTLAFDDVEGRAQLLHSAIAAFDHVGFASPGLAGFFPARQGCAVVPNASDPAHFDAQPLPASPVVGLVGSTAPGRGAEQLIQACEIAREQIPDLTLRLALNDIGGRGNLAGLQSRYGDRNWLSFHSIGYADLPAFLREVVVCTVPHPRTEYTDIALPLKLFDYMAAGRPVVATDCPAMSEVVLGCGAGLVCASDPPAIAEALQRLLTDRPLATRLGRNGRAAVEATHNWDVSLGVPLAMMRQRMDDAALASDPRHVRDRRGHAPGRAAG